MEKNFASSYIKLYSFMFLKLNNYVKLFLYFLFLFVLHFSEWHIYAFCRFFYCCDHISLNNVAWVENGRRLNNYVGKYRKEDHNPVLHNF